MSLLPISENTNIDSVEPAAIAHNKAEYVTVLTVVGRGNKRVSRDKSGKVKKEAGPPIYKAIARTIRVENCRAMELLQREIGSSTHQLLSLGFVPGSEPEGEDIAGTPYKFISRKIMGEALGVDPETPEGSEAVLGWHDIDGERCICRLKANMVPGSWCMLDIDAVRGMPDDLSKMSRDERLEALAEIISGFADAGLVIVPSTTGRVLVDGVPMDATGEHYYLQMQDATDLERFGAVLLQRSLLRGFGFMRPRYSKSDPSVVVSHVPWGIVDPTTFSHERLVYDGAPTVRGDGLAVAGANIETVEGGRLDTSLLRDLTDDEAAAYAEITGQRVVKERRTERIMGANGELICSQVQRFSAIDERLLQMNTKIETRDRVITLEEYWKSDAGKLRCQTPFRESTSENGILNRHADGTPFVYDNGIRVRYVLSAELIRKHRAGIYVTRLALLPAEEIKEVWTDGLRWMEPYEREYIRQRVHKLADVGLKELSSKLKSAIFLWQKDTAKAATVALKADIKDGGRAAIVLDSIDIGETINQVEEILFADRDDEPVMSHGGRVVSVRMAKPTTVREVRRENDAKPGEVPLTMMVDPYLFFGLMTRLSKCVAFIMVTNGRWEEVPPPNNVVRAMLEQSHKRASSLVGIIEHPVMGLDGELYVADGLTEDGLFVRISEDLIPNFDDNITSNIANESMKWITDMALADFPFATEIDVAGAVAALLTAVQRRMFDRNEGCPGFLTTAPIQSSGKTAFFQLLFELVWGRTAAATNWSSSDEELGKHILGILLEGHGGVLFDNLEEGGNIESNALARAMTSPKFTGRVLGENRQATVPTNCLWCFTGNNISASGDFNARILSISIDPEMEHPDQRTFSRPDLARWCETHRAEFYKHALTIMVGYQRHLRNGGDPCSVKPTRYGNWDSQVRHAMLWAGSPDPASLFEQNKVEDPKREGRRNLLAAWHDVYRDDPKLLSEVLSAALFVPEHTTTERDGYLRNLGEAIRDLLPNGIPTSSNLGVVIRKFAGQWIDGYRITAESAGEKSRRSRRWYVESRQS